MHAEYDGRKRPGTLQIDRPHPLHDVDVEV